MKCPSALLLIIFIDQPAQCFPLKHSSSFKLTLYHKNKIDMFNARFFVTKDIKERNAERLSRID